MSALGRAASSLLAPWWSSRAPSEFTVLALRRTEAEDAAALDRVVGWLYALDHTAQVMLLTDRLDAQAVEQRLTAGGSRDDEMAMRDLAGRIAGLGLVERRLFVAVPQGAEDKALAGLAEGGLHGERLDARAAAGLVRRMLLGDALPDVMDRLAAEDRPPAVATGGRVPALPGLATGLGTGQRTWHRHALPDQISVYPGHVDGDDGSAVLMFIDGLPRELESQALCTALRAPEPVDVSVHLWPLSGDEVIRHLTRRLRDLRSTRAVGGASVGDVRVETAITDADILDK